MQNPFGFRPTPKQAAKAKSSAANSGVQTSLFMRLKSAYPHNRGKISWLLVWAGTPSHAKRGEAVACLRSVPDDELAALRLAVEGCANASGREHDDAWQGLVARILDALDESRTAAPVTNPVARRADPEPYRVVILSEAGEMAPALSNDPIPSGWRRATPAEWHAFAAMQTEHEVPS